MGGPFWARKDAGAWTIPKGVAERHDPSPTATAEREFREELGQPAPPASADHDDRDLGVHRSGSKEVHVIARRGDLDPGMAGGGTFIMEWPPKSGRHQEFPEVDRAEWMTVSAARVGLAGNQKVFLDRLLDALGPPP